MGAKKKKVKEIMNRDIETVSPDDTARDIAEFMRHQDVSVVPVCEDGKLLGTLEDRDFTRGLVAEGLDPATVLARDVMNPEIATCAEDDDVDVVTSLMEERGTHRVFVIDPNGRLKGLVSLGKIARTESERAAGRVVMKISKPPSSRRAV